MAKKQPNLAAVLEDLAPTDAVAKRRTVNLREGPGAPETVLVGANLSPRYARNLAMLHAETGRTKKDLLEEALDMLFVAKGGASLKL